MRPKYCQPSEAGLASEGKSVARRLARLLTSLEVDINKYIVTSGPETIEQDIWEFKVSLLKKLQADGWQIEPRESGSTGSEWSVKVPKDYLK